MNQVCQVLQLQLLLPHFKISKDTLLVVFREPVVLNKVFQLVLGNYHLFFSVTIYYFNYVKSNVLSKLMDKNENKLLFRETPVL